MNTTLKAILIVFAGSGIGGVCRYGTQIAIAKIAPSAIPWGTFTANIAGCLLIGIFYELGAKENILSAEWRLALATGFCGGFTTFSSFAYENLSLLKAGDTTHFFIYLFLSIITGLLAVLAGVAIIK